MAVPVLEGLHGPFCFARSARTIAPMNKRTLRKASSPAWWKGRLSCTAAGLLILAIVSTSSPASPILTTLGSAGPSNWAILVGPGTTDFALNGPGTTNGNVGYAGSNTVQLNASSGKPAVKGDLYLGTNA